MKYINVCIIFLIMSITHISCVDNEYEIYVAPNGNDNSTGEVSAPVASI